MSDDIKTKTFDAEVRASGERSMRFVISTEGVDRDNDTIRASGWKLAGYRQNPVVLWAHDHKQLPVARCTDVHVEGDRLVAVAEFPTRDLYKFGATVLRPAQRRVPAGDVGRVQAAEVQDERHARRPRLRRTRTG